MLKVPNAHNNDDDDIYNNGYIGYEKVLYSKLII